MNISRKSALKKVGVAVGSATLLGFVSPDKKNNDIEDASKTDFNIRDYGATGDGSTDDTASINKAITEAAAAGGGRVCFPPGTYSSGSIHLKSNITLYLGHGAVLEATDNAAAYDPYEPFKGEIYQDFGHSHWHNSLIWGENLENVIIEGPGMIYGKGLKFYASEKDQEFEKKLANKAIALKNCRNVRLNDFTIKHGGWFALLATGVDNLFINNLLIDTNNDGLDIDCCRNVHITNCIINAPHDDSISLKSSYALGYARVTQNLTIANCVLSGYREGSVLDGAYLDDTRKSATPNGRIKFGSESNGGFRNITISNCVFDNCRGLALESVDGALLEDISISNITMRDIFNAPIFMRLGSRMRGPKGTAVGELRRINIDNVVVHNADNATGVLISGIPGHRIKDVRISNIYIGYKGGGAKAHAAITPPAKADDYPDPSRFGIMPSYAFYLRHVEDIEINNAKITYTQEEARPPFVLDDVAGADFRFIKAKHADNTPTFSLNNVKNFLAFEVNSIRREALEEVKGNKKL